MAEARKFNKGVAWHLYAGEIEAMFEVAIDSLPNVAFRTPDGRAVLLVLNTDSDMQLVNIRSNGRTASHILDGGAVGTYVWRL